MTDETIETKKDTAPEAPKASTIQEKSKDWASKLFDLDLLAPIYIVLFIILFKDGADGIDLHDAIIRFIANYNN